MMISKRPTAILAVLMLLAVTPAMSAIFRVQLKNGNSFATRYQPKVAEWDESKVVFLTDVGNRITLAEDDIVSITTDTQAKGFGTVLDTTTIVLGWAPNDAPIASDPSTEDQFAAYLDSLRRDRPVNTVQQFVNTEDAGQGGLSTWEFGASNFTGGPAGQQSPPVFVPPPPTAQTLPGTDGGGGGPGPGGGGEN